MNRCRRGAAFLVACVAVALPVGSIPAQALDCASFDDLCNAYNNAQQQQQQTQDELAQIQNSIKDVQQQMARLYAYISQLTAQIDRTTAQIAATQRQIDDTDRQIRYSEADVARRQAHLEVREALFDERVRAIEKHGNVNYLALFLSSTSFTQLVDRMLMAQRIVDSDQRMIDDLRAQRQSLQAAQDQLRDQRAKEASLLQTQTAQRARLEAAKAQQQAALAYQQQLEREYKAQADALAKQQAVIADQIAALQAALDARARGAGGGTGKFGWPEQLGTFYVSQGFGCSPYLFELYWPSCPSKHFHSGLDIAGPYGNEVYAADNGIVQTYSTPYGYGNYIVIVHGNGYASLYGHLAGFASGIKNGDVVYRGELIAYEGSTGNSTGPHLHFEIRNSNADPSDPYLNPCAFLSGC
jgi:murein DD-endopeptidase MepM/ murein hydrolase activator NlpD